jgi:hypothetical protein
MTQQTAYYLCDDCGDTWITSWGKDRQIEDMRDYCQTCTISSNYTKTPVLEPFHVTNVSKEEHKT